MVPKQVIFTYIGCVVSTVGTVSILVLAILQLYHFIKTKKKTNVDLDRFSYLTNILTIVVIFLFWSCSCLFLLMYTGLAFRFMSCESVYSIIPKVVQVAMYNKWIVFILRIKMVFNTSIYAYKGWKLLIFVIVFSFINLTTITLSELAVHSHPYVVNDNDKWVMCILEVPKWFGIWVGSTDMIISFICMYLFIKPLRRMYITKAEIELKNHVSRSKTHTVTVTVTEASTAESTTKSISESGNELSSRRKGDDLQKFVRKYAILTTVAGVTSVMFYGMASMSQQGFPSIVDFIFNSYSLALMSKWYDNSKNRCYSKLCCGPIKCANKCCAIKV